MKLDITCIRRCLVLLGLAILTALPDLQKLASWGDLKSPQVLVPIAGVILAGLLRSPWQPAAPLPGKGDGL